MLRKILSREDCAACRYCCSFRRQSLWELPLMEREVVEKLRLRYPEAQFAKAGGKFLVMDYTGLYQTEDPDEEVLCFFNRGGCVLSEAEKPFACKLWPLHVMRKDHRLVIALSPGCPVVAQIPRERVEALVHEEIGPTIWAHTAAHPEIIMDYREGYPVIEEQPRETDLRTNKKKQI